MKKEVTNEELARKIAQGFEGVDNRFEEVNRKIDKLDGRVDKLDGRVGKLEDDMTYVRGTVQLIERKFDSELEDLSARTKYVEKKLGIESGK